MNGGCGERWSLRVAIAALAFRVENVLGDHTYALGEPRGRMLVHLASNHNSLGADCTRHEEDSRLIGVLQRQTIALDSNRPADHI